MPAVPRRRVPLFVVYAFLSGIYSYIILFFMVRFVYNVTFNFLAELAVLPAAMVFYLMFKSRLRSLRKVIAELWEKHFGGGRSIRPVHFGLAVALLLLLFVPIFRDREDAYYVVEPLYQDTLHAAVPGRVDSVFVHEGESVHAGQPMLNLSSPLAATMSASATAMAGEARYHAFNAEMQGQTIGAASAQQSGSQRSARVAADAEASRVITAPFEGVVLTEDPASLQGQQVASGQALVSLAATGDRALRVYVPVSSLKRIPSAAEMAIVLPGQFSPIHLTLTRPGGDPVALPAGIIARQDYKGVKLPDFYAARVVLPQAAGAIPFGASGDAKIFGGRRSLAARGFSIVANLVKAHVW
jgi:biotin carboxyl carrier protein